MCLSLRTIYISYVVATPLEVLEGGAVDDVAHDLVTLLVQLLQRPLHLGRLDDLTFEQMRVWGGGGVEVRT